MNTGEAVKTKEGPLRGPMMMQCHELLSVINSTLFVWNFFKNKVPRGSHVLVRKADNRQPDA